MAEREGPAPGPGGPEGAPPGRGGGGARAEAAWKRVQKYIEAFHRTADAMEGHSEMLRESLESNRRLAEAVENLTDVLSMYGDLLGRSGRTANPFDAFCRLLDEALGRR